MRSRRLHQRNQRFFPNVSKAKPETQSQKSPHNAQINNTVNRQYDQHSSKIGFHFPILLKIPRAYAPKTQKDRAESPKMNLFSLRKYLRNAPNLTPCGQAGNKKIGFRENAALLPSSPSALAETNYSVPASSSSGETTATPVTLSPESTRMTRTP